MKRGIDEAVSALDVSVQASTLNLLSDLRERLNRYHSGNGNQGLASFGLKARRKSK